MTAPYKKCAKGNWKHDKKQSSRDERKYSKVEIEDQLHGKSKAYKKSNTKNSSLKIHKEIYKMIKTIKFALYLSNGELWRLKMYSLASSTYMSSIRQSYYQESKKYIPKLQKLSNDDKLPAKVKRAIKEILDQCKEV